MKTKVHDNAGKFAKYDDVFLLDNVEEQAKAGNNLIMQAYDHDVGTCDLLGEANPVSLLKMCADEEKHIHKLDIFYEFKKTGFLVFESRFVY